MAKRKLRTLVKEIDEAAKLIQRLVRLKASDDNGYCSCVTCGVTGHYKDFDGGHYFSRRHLRLKLFEENIHPQCTRCNRFLMGDGQTNERYRDFMVDTYGLRRFKAMEKLTYMPPPKFHKADVIAFRSEIEERIKIEKYRIGEI
jgi:hypothetical protein